MDINEEFIEESLQCCLLCTDVRNVLKSLAIHMKLNHFDDYKTATESTGSSKISLCSCQEGIDLQVQLISHLLHQIIPKSRENLIFDDHEELPVMTEDIKSEEESSTEDVQPPPVKSSRSYPCKFCSKVLLTKSGLAKHKITIHNTNNKFKCPHCDNGHCNTLKNLHAHMRIHEDVDLNSKVCQKCNKKFKSEKQFYHHLLLHRQKLLECDFCGMRFNMKQPLQKHILHIHLDIRTQRETKPKSLCEICSKWVSSSRRHLATHFHELRPANFKCDFEGCEKSFTEMRNLQDHHNTHTSLSPYVCDFCNSTFRHRAALRSHRIRHTDPEKYKCEICCECFVTNQSLKKHISRQHRDSEVDVRPFKCDIENCTSTFKYEDFLVRHKKEVHSPKPQIQQKCDHCSYVACNIKNFFQHMRRAHNIKKRINNRVFPTSLRDYD